jgi:hypothetical protein
MSTYTDDVIECADCFTDAYLMDLVTWTKYSYTCTNCDALIEVTSLISPIIDPACICSPGSWVTRTALEPAVQPNVMSITPTQIVKINTNPYN